MVIVKNRYQTYTILPFILGIIELEGICENKREERMKSWTQKVADN